MRATKEMCPRGGNPAGTEAKKVSSDPTSSANVENITAFDVYKISPTTFMRIPVKLGANGKRVLEQAMKVARLIDASRIPTPYRVVFESGHPAIIECGRAFETVKRMPPLTCVTETETVLANIGVTTLVIMRNGWDSNLYVDYGRIGRVEFMASVFSPVHKAGDR